MLGCGGVNVVVDGKAGIAVARRRARDGESDRGEGIGEVSFRASACGRAEPRHPAEGGKCRIRSATTKA